MAKLKDNHTHTREAKKTSFLGTENQRDVPQLALPFSSFDLGGLLPPLLSVHSTPSPGRKGLFSCGCSLVAQRQRITRRRYAPPVVFSGNPDIVCNPDPSLPYSRPPCLDRIAHLSCFGREFNQKHEFRLAFFYASSQKRCVNFLSLDKLPFVLVSQGAA